MPISFLSVGSGCSPGCFSSSLGPSCFLPRYRRAGLYAIVVSTTTTLASSFAYSFDLYFGLIGMLFFAIGLGAAIGAIAGFSLVRRFARR